MLLRFGAFPPLTLSHVHTSLAGEDFLLADNVNLKSSTGGFLPPAVHGLLTARCSVLEEAR